MSRRRTTPDAAVLEATFRVVSRVGPGKLTLADVAAEAGLAPATLLQRFGSKRGLLLAVAETTTAGVEACFAQARAAHRSPIEALFASFDQMTCCAETPEALANSLAFLQIDLTDPDFRRLAVEGSRATIAGFRALLEDAVAAGQLARCDTTGLARLIQAASHGSMVTWAFHREGLVKDWLRRDMEMLLAPFRVVRRKNAKRKKRRAVASTTKRRT